MIILVALQKMKVSESKCIQTYVEDMPLEKKHEVLLGERAVTVAVNKAKQPVDCMQCILTKFDGCRLVAQRSV